jgi:hypothetical protein
MEENNRTVAPTNQRPESSKQEDDMTQITMSTDLPFPDRNEVDEPKDLSPPDPTDNERAGEEAKGGLDTFTNIVVTTILNIGIGDRLRDKVGDKKDQERVAEAWRVLRPLAEKHVVYPETTTDLQSRLDRALEENERLKADLDNATSGRWSQWELDKAKINAAIKHYELFKEPELKAQLTAATQRNAEVERELTGLRDDLRTLSADAHGAVEHVKKYPHLAIPRLEKLAADTLSILKMANAALTRTQE